MSFFVLNHLLKLFNKIEKNQPKILNFIEEKLMFMMLDRVVPKGDI